MCDPNINVFTQFFLMRSRILCGKSTAFCFESQKKHLIFNELTIKMSEKCFVQVKEAIPVEISFLL